MKKSKTNLAFVTLWISMSAWMLFSAPSSATLEIQKTAKEKGFPATNCQYCHEKRHPRKETAAYNDRGKWLIAERDRRLSKFVDPAWLHFYPGDKK